jgi:hypothetical protein
MWLCVVSADAINDQFKSRVARGGVRRGQREVGFLSSPRWPHQRGRRRMKGQGDRQVDWGGSPFVKVAVAAEESHVGEHVPVRYEKLPNFDEAVDLCEKLTYFGGIGHSADIHSNNTNRLEL